MKKTFFQILILVFILSDFLCASSRISQEIATEYKDFIGNSNEVIQIRQYNDTKKTKLLVDFYELNNSNPNECYISKLTAIDSEIQNRVINIERFVIKDFTNNKLKILNKNKDVIVDKQYKTAMEGSKIQDVLRLKKDAYVEDFAVKPFLGENFLNNLVSTDKVTYYGNDIKIKKWNSLVLVPDSGLKVKINFTNERIIEKYQDSNGDLVIRILEKTSNINYSNSDYIENFTRNIPNKYASILKGF